MNQIRYLIIEIIKYALNQQYVDSFDIGLLKEININDLYEYCVFHRITGLVAVGLDNISKVYKDVIDASDIQRWNNLRYQIVSKIIQFDNEKDILINEFEKEDIWYMPLKGIVLKDLYPEIGMRDMLDYDILIDSNYREKIKDIFISHGYRTNSNNEDRGHDDEYLKEPSYNFEMHWSLGNTQEHIRSFNEYYSDHSHFMVKDDNNNNGYHMSNEDFYVYMVAHTYKHYNLSGTGIRNLVDVYVYLNKYNDVLNWEYIKQELTKIGIVEFENTFRNLATKIFGFNDCELNEKEDVLLEYMSCSGIHGTEDIHEKLKLKRLENNGESLQDINIVDSISNKTKFKYFKNRMFPTKEALMERYEFCKNHPNVYWLIHFKRIFDGLTINSKRLKEEVKRTNKL